MALHGGAQELMLVIVFTSSLLVLLGVYLSRSGILNNSVAAALWTALCLAPLIFGGARYLGYA